MNGALVAAVASPMVLLVLALVIGRMLRTADRLEETRAAAPVRAADPAAPATPATDLPEDTQPDDRITLGRG